MTGQAADHTQRVGQLFDAKAPAWSAKYQPSGRLAERLSQINGVLQRHLAGTAHVLDLGCGTGDIARAAASAGMQVTGCDISREMLSRASELDENGTVSWLELDADWCCLPFETAAFDGVVASSVLEYVKDPHLVFSQCARVLRPGGILVCTVPNMTHPVRWLEWAGSRFAILPVFNGGRHHGVRLDRYLAYLRLSKQRHRSRWWSELASSHGLMTSFGKNDTPAWSPLRLLVFQRTSET